LYTKCHHAINCYRDTLIYVLDCFILFIYLLFILFAVISSTLCLKKVPTVTFNRFSKFLLCWKAGEIFFTKATQYYPPHLSHVTTLPWDIKILNLLQIFSRYGKMQTNHIFSVPILITLPA